MCLVAAALVCGPQGFARPAKGAVADKAQQGRRSPGAPQRFKLRQVAEELPRKDARRERRMRLQPSRPLRRQLRSPLEQTEKNKKAQARYAKGDADRKR